MGITAQDVASRSVGCVGRCDSGSYITVLMLIIVGTILLLIGGFIHWIWKTYGAGRFRGTEQCHLCLERIWNDKWMSGEHRRQCSATLFQKLDKMPQHHSKKCPLCRETVRMWPELGEEMNQGDAFKCYNSQCLNVSEESEDGNLIQRMVHDCVIGPKLGDIQNNGNNRFCCFLCNVSFCLQCVNAVEANSVNPGEVEKPSLIKKSSLSPPPDVENPASNENKSLLPPSYQEAMHSKP